MARYEITGPDGAKYEVMAPDSATEAEVLAYAKQKFGSVQTSVEPAQAESAAPKVATLDERQEQRAALEGKLETLKRQIQDLEDARGGVADEYQAQLDDSIATLRRQQKVLAEQIDRTGVGSTGNKVGSTVGSIVGGLGGAAAGSLLGPKGTVAGGVAGSAAGAAIGGAMGSKWDLNKAEPVTEEEATQLIASRAVEDVLWDVGGNALFIVGGKALKLAITPGLKDRLRAALAGEKVAKRVGVATEKRVASTRELFDPKSAVPGQEAAREATEAAAREKAVAELSDRSRGYVPTPGQVAGKASTSEKVVRSLRADEFKPQEEALTRAAEGMREEVVAPHGQPSRPELGNIVTRQAKAVETAVKNRTRPVFEAAKRVGVDVDFSPVVARIEAALADDAAGAERLFKPSERADLEKMLRSLTARDENIVPILGPDGKPLQMDPSVKLTAGGAFDFISGNKSRLRDVSAVDVPSRHYASVLGDLNELADKQALDSIKQVGGAGLRDALLKAREDYRTMIGGIYDGSVQQALKKNPEDVGRLFWQNGNVTEVKQLQNLIEAGIREKTLDKDAGVALNEAMLRGFLAEAVPDIGSAAKWSDTLRKNPLKRDTYMALKNAPGMEKLDDGMRVLEQAAQIALTKNSDLAFSGSGMISNLPARIGIGISLGFIGPKAVAMFAGAEVWARMMATALAKKDAGAYRNILMVLRASSSDNPKVAAAARPAATSLIKWVKDLNDPELESQIDFGEQQEQQ